MKIDTKQNKETNVTFKSPDLNDIRDDFIQFELLGHGEEEIFSLSTRVVRFDVTKDTREPQRVVWLKDKRGKNMGKIVCSLMVILDNNSSA